MAATITTFAYDAVAGSPSYTSGNIIDWLWQSMHRNNGVLPDLDLALAVTADGTGNVLTQNGVCSLNGRTAVLSAGPQTTALTPLPASGFRTSYAVVMRFTAASQSTAVTMIAGSTIANPGPSVNPSIVAATDVLLAYVLAVNTAGTIVYTVTDARVFQSIGRSDTNVSEGVSALAGNYASGTGFVAIGYHALMVANTSVEPSTAVGYTALSSMTTGIRNSAFGALALSSLTTGTDSSAFGNRALALSTTGTNSAFGGNALQLLTTGTANCAFGYASLNLNVTGSSNCAFGDRSLLANLASNNSAFGYLSLTANTTGTSNSAFGYGSLAANTTASFNSAFGYNSLVNNTVGSSLSAFGFTALASNTTGVSNSAFGAQALQNNTTGSNNNAFGVAALAFNFTGSNNSAFGSSALLNNTVSNNSAFGYQALMACTTSTDNTAVGANALTAVTTGLSNTAVGSSAGSAITGTGNANTCIGATAGSNITSGGNNTCLGSGSAAAAANSVHSITLGNASITIIRAQVTTITALSDARDKKDITKLPEMLPLIRDLNGVIFKWDMREKYATKDANGLILRDDNGMPIYDKENDGSLKDDHFTLGVISQELKALQEKHDMPWLDLVYDENPNRIEAKPGNLLIPAIKAIQELANIVDELKQEIAILKNK